MNNFRAINKNFLTIIIGAIIIGGFVYFAIKNAEVVVSPKKESIAVSDTAIVSKVVANAGLSQDNSAENGSPLNLCGADDNTIVTKVIDGDTVVVEGGYHVRLLGMDADEKGYPCYDAAKTRLENLVLSKQVILEKDVSDVDQYGRCLRYIFLGSENVDTQLVREGLAVSRFYQPDGKYRTEITNAETYAQQNKIGCKWSGITQTAK